jgi:hypothetical protein
MLITFHHHSETRDQNLPWDIPSTELINHAIIDVVHVQGTLTCFYSVTVIETEGLTHSLILGKGGLLVILSTLGILLQ